MNGQGSVQTELEKVGKAEYICSLLKEMIFSWQLVPGQKINIRQLSQKMNVSAIPMREALSRLHSEKLIILEPNKGYRVSEILDYEKMSDMFEARILMETYAVRSIIRNNRTDIVPILADSTAQMAKVNNLESYKEVLKFVQWDQVFHKILMEASENSFLSEAYNGMHCHLHIARFYHVRGEVDQKEAVTEHEEIIEAIRTRDVYRADKAVVNHINDVKNRLMVIHRKNAT